VKTKNKTMPDLSKCPICTLYKKSSDFFLVKAIDIELDHDVWICSSCNEWHLNEHKEAMESRKIRVTFSPVIFIVIILLIRLISNL